MSLKCFICLWKSICNMYKKGWNGSCRQKQQPRTRLLVFMFVVCLFILIHLYASLLTQIYYLLGHSFIYTCVFLEALTFYCFSFRQQKQNFNTTIFIEKSNLKTFKISLSVYVSWKRVWFIIMEVDNSSSHWSLYPIWFIRTHIETDALGGVINVASRHPNFTFNTFSYMGLQLGEIASGFGGKYFHCPKTRRQMYYNCARGSLDGSLNVS